jgi:predicted AlkP superfamily phosphohydrolase/phosphomutase
MTENRFKVVKHLMAKEEWDYLMFVEIGVDRLHHMFWKYYDRSHPRYTVHHKYSKAIPEYYKYLDEKIGELLSMIDSDTYVLVVSDHGTASMKGAFCINEWLIKEGYLVLKKYPDSVTDFDKCEVNWEKTTAWGWGGYHGRIFLNVIGRETSGQIQMNKYDEFRDSLKLRLSTIVGPQGEEFDNKIFYPEELYPDSNGSKPDIMVYFDNLFWRSAGTIGHKTLYLSENDTGPDDSVHWMDGVFLLYNKAKTNHTTKLDRLSIYDIAPTVLDIMGVKAPQDMNGKVQEGVSKWVRS